MNWLPSRMFEAGLKRLADNHAGLWFSARRRFLNQLDEKSLLLLWWEELQMLIWTELINPENWKSSFHIPLI